MGNRVPRIKTVVSDLQMAPAIVEAWTQLFGTSPSKEQVGMIIAHSSLETGHGQKMWNNNIGNITTDGKGSYDFYDDLTTDEQVQPGVWKKKNLKYRSYPTLIEGVKDYLKFLSGSSRYSSAWANIINPDPVAFSKALKNSGYYTANEGGYTKTLSKLYNKYTNSNNYEQAMSAPQASKSSIPNDPSILNQSNDPLNDILNNYLQMVAASEKSNKKFYKRYLPYNNIVIKLASSDYTDVIEFGRVLCAILDYELLSKSFIHTDGNNVEVECVIAGPQKECVNLINELTNISSNVFKNATSKIGGSIIKYDITNKKSSYKQISLSSAETQYRKFLLKFI